jgi:hypothetical protein
MKKNSLRNWDLDLNSSSGPKKSKIQLPECPKKSTKGKNTWLKIRNGQVYTPASKSMRAARLVVDFPNTNLNIIKVQNKIKLANNNIKKRKKK